MDGIGSIAKYVYFSGKFRRFKKRGKAVKWSESELDRLVEFFPTKNRRDLLKKFPGRSWWSIEGKAHLMNLKRPKRAQISSTLFRQGDIGFSAGMIIADGSVLESLISSGIKRGRLDGHAERPRRWYSTPQVQVSMEDKESLGLLGKMWGASVTFCQKSSVGNDVWRVYVHGRRAYDLLKIVLPYLAGTKRTKASYILKKYKSKTSRRVFNPEKFKAFGGVK